MTVHQTPTVYCDAPGCLRWYADESSTAKQVRAAAKAQRWGRRRVPSSGPLLQWQDLCPIHANRIAEP